MKTMNDSIKFVEVDVDDLDDYFEHHGILGMHWGERRYQNSDGTWTEEGLSRRRKGLVGRIGDTAKKATDAISTKARKKFNPTAEDLDEQIAKAKEKQKINEKKKELAELTGKNRKIKDMSDQEVWNEIQSRRNRQTLEEMRKEASTIQKGKNFAKGAAGIASVPAKALLDIAGDTATYGLKSAGRALIDVGITNAKEDAIKKHKLENRTESEKLQDKARDAKNKQTIADIEFEDSIRDIRNESQKWAARNERDANRMTRNVLRGNMVQYGESKKRLETYRDLTKQKKK